MPAATFAAVAALQMRRCRKYKHSVLDIVIFTLPQHGSRVFRLIMIVSGG